MEFLPVLAMAALAYKIVDFVRYLRAGDVNGVVTQLAAWIAGVAVVFLAAQSDWASGIDIGDKHLGALNAWSLLFVGLSVGSGASLIKDSIKAIDQTGNTAIPVLVPARQSPPPAGTVG